MEFHYYYIIQDIVGVLMAFIGIRMILSSKKSKNGILISISYALITIAGINLLFNNFGLKPWIVSIILILLSLLITNIVKTDKTI